MKVMVTMYDKADSDSFALTVVTQDFTNVFEVDRSDDTFFTVVHDHGGVTFEDLIRKSDIISVEINYEEDVIGPAKQARDDYRAAVEEQARQARLANNGLTLA